MRPSYSLSIRLAAAWIAGGTAFAQTPGDYPAKPVRLVVPFAPGASNDTLSRATADAMSPILGQPVVVDNRPGAGGMLGSEQVARAAPDGYTLLNVQASFATNAAIRAKMPYDVYKDFAYVGMMTRSPLLLVVHPSMPVASAKDLVALARKRPGELNYGSSGTGGSNHLVTELFARTAGIKIAHVPYKGVGPALVDLLGGHIQMAFASLPSALGHVRRGRLKALAVADDKRSPFAPDIPTAREGGVPFVAELWWGLAAPAKTPPETVAVLSNAMRKALQTAELKKQYAVEGGEPMPMAPARFEKYVLAEVERWRQVVKETGLSLQ
jgi:tripartite-type tricarboxylate transporter receptor subunit TctC